MNELTVTKHAITRMAQRSIDRGDIDLIRMLGTEVDDGFLVLRKDCQQAEDALKQLLKKIWRLEGKRLILAESKVVTTYRTQRKQNRQILRKARDHGLLNF